MKNKAFEGFLFKLTHPVSYDFTTEERELIAENVAVKTKIATGADIDIADVRRLSMTAAVILHIIRQLEKLQQHGKTLDLWLKCIKCLL